MQGTVLVYFIFLWCSAALAHPAQVDETRRGTGGPLSQIRRDRSHLGVRSGQCSFWGLEHAWLGLSVRATKIHLWKCPWRSAWMEEERKGDLQFITSRSPEKKSNSSFFVADARLHQHKHTSPSRSSQLPASFVRPMQVRQKKTIPNLPLEFSVYTWSWVSVLLYEEENSVILGSGVSEVFVFCTYICYFSVQAWQPC